MNAICYCVAATAAYHATATGDGGEDADGRCGHDVLVDGRLHGRAARGIRTCGAHRQGAGSLNPGGGEPCATVVPVLTSVVCVLVTTQIRGHVVEVQIGQEEGLQQESVANCDNLLPCQRQCCVR